MRDYWDILTEKKCMSQQSGKTLPTRDMFGILKDFRSARQAEPRTQVLHGCQSARQWDDWVEVPATSG